MRKKDLLDEFKLGYLLQTTKFSVAFGYLDDAQFQHGCTVFDVVVLVKEMKEKARQNRWFLAVVVT